MSDELMNREEAAIYIGVSVRTLQRYIKGKKITFVKQPGSRGRMEYRFDKKALDDWKFFKDNVTYREDNQTNQADKMPHSRHESYEVQQDTNKDIRLLKKTEQGAQSDIGKDRVTGQEDISNRQKDRQETGTAGQKDRQYDSLVDRLLSSLESQNAVLIEQLSKKDEQIAQLTEMIDEYKKQFNDRLLEYKQIAAGASTQSKAKDIKKTSRMLRDDVPEEKRDVLSAMLQLRNEGFSGREIADILNERQVETFSGQGNWTKKKVNDTLLRWLM